LGDSFNGPGRAKTNIDALFKKFEFLKTEDILFDPV